MTEPLRAASATAVVRIEWLGAHPGNSRTLADWHVRAFAEWVSGWQIDEAEHDLVSHTHSRTLPTTLVALDAHDELLGSVSLLTSDPPAPDRYAPWLASLYVRPAARRRGIGAQLVHAAVAEAQRLGVPLLHLWTPDQAAFYARLGWRSLGLHTFGQLRVTLMQFDCTAAAVPATT